jgi:hypothetical protein
MSTPSAPNIYQLQNQPGADQGAYGGTQGISQMPNYAQNTYNQYQPAFQSTSQASGYNPATTVNYANQNSANLQAAGQQVLNTAFDPQSALYNQSFQQLTDQTRSGLEARGLDNTPYGAGVENQADTNFNIAWQQQQLANQTQGLQAYNQASSGINAAQNTALGVPVAQAGLQSANQQAGIQNYSQPQMTVQDYLAYLSAGNQSNQNALSLYNTQAQQNTQGMAGLGQLGGTIFGGLTNGGADGFDSSALGTLFL